MEMSIGGRRLAYDSVGQGVPIVLLHAFPFDRRFFLDIANRLARHARVIVPDLRGFGESERSANNPADNNEGWSIADLADDVAALLDHLSLPRAVIGGLSMGGYVSLAFAARHPRRMSGILLANTRADADSPETRAARADAITLVRNEGVAAYVEKQLPRLLSPSASEAVRNQVRALAGQHPDTVVAGLEAMRARPDRTAELLRIDCPALVIVGADDVITPPAEATNLATNIPGAVLAEIPATGHLSNLEAPAPFAQAIVGYLPRVH